MLTDVDLLEALAGLLALDAALALLVNLIFKVVDLRVVAVQDHFNESLLLLWVLLGASALGLLLLNAAQERDVLSQHLGNVSLLLQLVGNRILDLNIAARTHEVVAFLDELTCLHQI